MTQCPRFLLGAVHISIRCLTQNSQLPEEKQVFWIIYIACSGTESHCYSIRCQESWNARPQMPANGHRWKQAFLRIAVLDLFSVHLTLLHGMGIYLSWFPLVIEGQFLTSFILKILSLAFLTMYLFIQLLVIYFLSALETFSSLYCLNMNVL